MLQAAAPEKWALSDSKELVVTGGSAHGRVARNDQKSESLPKRNSVAFGLASKRSLIDSRRMEVQAQPNLWLGSTSTLHLRRPGSHQ